MLSDVPVQVQAALGLEMPHNCSRSPRWLKGQLRQALSCCLLTHVSGRRGNLGAGGNSSARLEAGPVCM